MCSFNFLLEFMSTFFRNFAKETDCPFIFPGCDFFVIDVVLFQKAMKVWNLCDHSDASHNREGRRKYLRARASHHVASTRGHFVHADGEWNAAIANAKKLSCS